MSIVGYGTLEMFRNIPVVTDPDANYSELFHKSEVLMELAEETRCSILLCMSIQAPDQKLSRAIDRLSCKFDNIWDCYAQIFLEIPRTSKNITLPVLECNALETFRSLGRLLDVHNRSLHPVYNLADMHVLQNDYPWEYVAHISLTCCY
jgi:hypothetical protein